MNFDKQASEFAKSHKISVLTTLIAGGMPHSSTMHYAYDPEKTEFIFYTKRASRKLSALKESVGSNASMVIGFSQVEWKELQMEGEVVWLSSEKSKKEQEVYNKNFAGAELDSAHVVVKFTPKWWTYTVFKPKQIVISSE